MTDKMIDNRPTELDTTELLCKLLDERGIEWKNGDASHEIEWITPDGRHCSAMYWNPTFTVLVSGCTPEQAIAATLGSGTLTAEQVREVVYRNSTYNDIYKVYQVSRTDMQAITDELNADMGSGTCECSWHGFVDGWGYEPPNYCPNCGGKVVSE